MRRGLALLLVLLTVILCGLLIYLAFPYVASAYHLEAGGRAMSDPDLALDHLQQATEWLPDNSQAYRLQAQVFHSRRDWLAAVEAQARFTELRPDNPLGYIEMAELYEEIEAEMEAMHIAELLDLLPEAQVQAPEAPIDTPYGSPDGPAWSYYVAETTFSLPVHYGQRPTLFMHAPSSATYRLELPAPPAVLRFDMGFDPQAQSWLGDGATFEVFVDGQRVFLEHMDEAMALEGWHRRAVDLSYWAGQPVELTLAVTPGPQADPAGDWAGWGEPRVVDARWPELEALNPAGRAKEAWENAGMTAESFVLWGEAARQQGQFKEALRWYERAMELEPALGDPWYYVGRLRADQGQWLAALDAYERALSAEYLRIVGRSSLLHSMGSIYQLRLDPPRLEDALAAYEEALEVDQFINQGQSAAWVHARLGQVYYSLHQDFAFAEREVLLALDMAPDQRWLYVLAGDLYKQAGQRTKAQDMYERALRISPGFEAAQSRLDAIQ